MRGYQGDDPEENRTTARAAKLLTPITFISEKARGAQTEIVPDWSATQFTCKGREDILPASISSRFRKTYAVGSLPIVQTQNKS